MLSWESSWGAILEALVRAADFLPSVPEHPRGPGTTMTALGQKHLKCSTNH